MDTQPDTQKQEDQKQDFSGFSFDLGSLPGEKESGDQKENEQETEDKREEIKQNEEGKQGEEGKQDEEGKQNEEGKQSEEGKQDEKGEQNEEGKQSEEKGTNPFGIEEEEKEKYNKEISSEPLKNLASRLDIEIGEEDDIDVDSISEKITKKINESSKYDIDKLSPLQKKFFEKIENDPEIIPDIYRNEQINRWDSYLNSDTESKYKQIRSLELRNKGTNQDDISEMLEDEMSDLTETEMSKKVKEVDRQVKKARNTEIERIITEEKETANKREGSRKEQLKAQRAKIAESVDNVDDFIGFDIPKERKALVKSKINDGSFDEEMQNASPEDKIKAYYALKYYNRIEQKIQEMLKSHGVKEHGNGMSKMIEMFHNIKPAGDGSNNSHVGGQGTGNKTGSDKPFFSKEELSG